MKDKKPVLLFQRIVPSYRVSMFRYLYEQLNVIVCHSKTPKFGKIISKAEEIDYPNQFVGSLYYLKRETAVIQNVFKPLLKYRPEVVISPASVMFATTWLLLLLRPIFRYKLILWGHGIKENHNDVPFTGIREKLAKWLFNSSGAMLLYSHQRKEALEKYIETPVFVALNTLDTKRFLPLLQDLEKQGIESVKKDVGFTTPNNIIFIGRLLPAKRIDLLLESFVILAETLDVTLHIVGDGSEMDLVKKYQKRFNIKTYGSVYDDKETAKLLFSSDVMVMPCYVGLSIVHAFSFGVPIIACRFSGSKSGHGPEIEFLRHNENGLFCEHNSQSIADAIVNLLGNKQKLKKFKQAARSTAYKVASIEKFVEGFGNAIKHTKKISN